MVLSSPLLVATLVLGGLAPAKVDNVTTNSAVSPKGAPSVIYVQRFSVDQTASSAKSADSDSDSDTDGDRPRLFGRLRGGDGILGRRREQQRDSTMEQLPGVLQKALVENLSQGVAHATPGDGSDGKPRSWLITGQFLVVDTGSRALQAGVGFGAGQGEVQVQAQVYLTSDTDTPFLVFDSKGASGHMPGAVVINPYVAAAKFVMSKKEPEKEAKKVAKAIAEEIGKFMAAQHIPTLKQKQQSGAASSPPISHSSKNVD